MQAEMQAEKQAEVTGRMSAASADQGYTGAEPAPAETEQGVELLVVKC